VEQPAAPAEAGRSTSSPQQPSAITAIGVLGARDAVLSHLRQYHSAEAPEPTLLWAEERTTPEGLIGSESYRYTAGDWVITISYPLTSAEMVLYQVVASNPATAFQWQGEVNATGGVAELGVAAIDPVQEARDATLAYLSENHAADAPKTSLTWTRARMTPGGLVGAETYQYRSGFWVLTIAYPVTAPDSMIYRITVSNENTGFRWQGEVDATGKVTETTGLVSGRSVVGWFGKVLPAPEGAQVVAYLALEPSTVGKVGLKGAAADLDAEIKSLRDSGIAAHFWGTLNCASSGAEICQLVVTRLRQDGEALIFDPDPVDRWEGTLHANEPTAQFDDYFVLAGDFPVRYGIDSADPALAEQLRKIRDTGSTVRVWGRLTCGVLDVNGSQISVIAVEVVGGSSSLIPAAVEDWVGVMVKLPDGAQYDDYFERDDGERYGIDSDNPDMQKQISALYATGSRVRIWGRLFTAVPDAEGRQIRVERYELVTSGQAVEGWVGTIVKLEAGAQYDDYFQRSDGQRYGIESVDPKLTRRLEALREQNAKVRIWGEVFTSVSDVEGRQIRVTELELAD
jgi:hypothetical protein